LNRYHRLRLEKRGLNYFEAVVVAAAVTVVLHPSFLKSAHSSQEVPLAKEHMPYSPPSAFFLISIVPLRATQLTDAGFARPVD